MSPLFCHLLIGQIAYNYQKGAYVINSYIIAGFIIDLMEQLSLMLDFPYEIQEAGDGKYGHRLSSGRWDGVIGEVKRAVSRKGANLT